MDLIEFKDLPDTSTALNATNINYNFSKLSDTLQDYTRVNDASITCKAKKIVPTLLKGGHQASFGGCYYYKIGSTVYVHIGVNGLTVNEYTTIFNVPEGYRPGHFVCNIGGGHTSSTQAIGEVASNGNVSVRSTGDMGNIDIIYNVFE